MKTVVFTKSGLVNGTKYKRDDELNVSSSIFSDLTEVQKCAKEKISKPKKSSKKEG